MFTLARAPSSPGVGDVIHHSSRSSLAVLALMLMGITATNTAMVSSEELYRQNTLLDSAPSGWDLAYCPNHGPHQRE